MHLIDSLTLDERSSLLRALLQKHAKRRSKRLRIWGQFT